MSSQPHRVMSGQPKKLTEYSPFSLDAREEGLLELAIMQPTVLVTKGWRTRSRTLECSWENYYTYGVT